MMSAYMTILKTGGEDLLVFKAVTVITEWIIEDKQMLSKNAAAFDKNLPTKMVYTV